MKNRALRVAVPLILAASGLHTQFAYVSFARGRGASFNEIPGATETRLNDEFRRHLAKVLVRRALEECEASRQAAG